MQSSWIYNIYIFIVEIVLSPRNPRTSFPFLFHSHEFPSSVSVLSILDSIKGNREFERIESLLLPSIEKKLTRTRGREIVGLKPRRRIVSKNEMERNGRGKRVFGRRRRLIGEKLTSNQIVNYRTILGARDYL